MRPRGLPSLSITASHASMQFVQPIQSSCKPFADVDCGRADDHASLAIDAIPRVFPFFPRGSPRVLFIADDDRLLVEKHGLQAPVRAHYDAELFTKPGEIDIRGGREGENPPERF